MIGDTRPPGALGRPAIIVQAFARRSGGREGNPGSSSRRAIDAAHVRGGVTARIIRKQRPSRA
jgi:hypothetical protein